MLLNLLTKSHILLTDEFTDKMRRFLNLTNKVYDLVISPLIYICDWCFSFPEEIFERAEIISCGFFCSLFLAAFKEIR